MRRLNSRNWTETQISPTQYRCVQKQSPVAYLKTGYWYPITDQIGSLGVSEVVGTEELADFRIRTSLEDGLPLFHYEVGRSFVEMSPMGVNTRQGVVTGNSIMFKDAWGGVDLEYINGGHILKEAIHLKSGHPSSFRFKINAQSGFDPKTLKFGTDFVLRQPVLETDSGFYVPNYIPLQFEVFLVAGHYELLITLPPGDYAGCVIDPILDLQPDAAAGYDNWMRSVASGDKLGTNSQMGCGDFSGGAYRERFLIKFALTGLPGGCTVDDVTLSLFNHYAEDSAGIGPWDVQLRRLYRNWVELNSSWVHYDDPSSWSGGGAGSDGNDRYGGDAALESCDEPASGAMVEWIQGTGTGGQELVECVQNWHDGGWNNYGLVGFAPAAEARSGQQAGSVFRTSDHTTSAERPELSIDYTPAVVERDRQADQVIFVMETSGFTRSVVDQIIAVIEVLDATSRASFQDVLAEFEQNWRLVSTLDVQTEFEQDWRLVSQMDIMVEYVAPSPEDMTQIRGWDQIKPWSIMPSRLHESVAGRGLESGSGNALVLKPHREKQVAEPTPNAGELWIWFDEGSGQIKLVYNDPDAGVKKVTLA